MSHKFTTILHTLGEAIIIPFFSRDVSAFRRTSSSRIIRFSLRTSSIKDPSTIVCAKQQKRNKELRQVEYIVDKAILLSYGSYFEVEVFAAAFFHLLDLGGAVSFFFLPDLPLLGYPFVLFDQAHCEWRELGLLRPSLHRSLCNCATYDSKIINSAMLYRRFN